VAGPRGRPSNVVLARPCRPVREAGSSARRAPRPLGAPPRPLLPQQARELASLLYSHHLASHVNLIPWNPVDDSDYQRPAPAAVAAFRRELEAGGVATSLRVTRGLEAAAACGQLRNEFQKQAVPEPRPLR
jgi:hypothetical protein